MSLPPEILKKVKLLEIATRRKVNNLLIGEYHSAFKGQGMTFSEFREYVPGDEVRSIAWPLYARTEKLYVKKYDEEREMTVMLAVDVSGSQDFGSQEYFKGEVAAHVAALLSFTATSNKDAVGLILFSDQIELYVPPKKGRGQCLRILRDLYYHKPASRGTNLSVALDHLLGVLKKKTHVFVISDFLDTNFQMSLRRLSKKHDTVAVVLEDKAEVEIPSMGLIDFEDPETGEAVTVDTSAPIFRTQYKKYLDEMVAARQLELRRSLPYAPPALPALPAAVVGAGQLAENSPKKPDIVTSDLVGVLRFSRPQVNEGHQLEADRELAFVEALGIRNPVRSRGPGRVAAVFVTDGQPVEYGQPLFAIDR